MKVVAISAPGGPDVLQLAERPVPQPGAGEVLIKVAAAGVNGPDLMQRKGLYPPPAGASDLPGLEVAGEIVAAGTGAGRWSVGDKVTALTNGGGYAEYCPVDARHCLPLPRGLRGRGRREPPRNLLHGLEQYLHRCGSRGGRGPAGAWRCGRHRHHRHTACQGIRRKVIATDSPEERCRICRELGADRVIDYRAEDYVEIVRAEGGANVILDIVGGPNIERNFRAASPDGRIVQLAFPAGSKVEVNLMPVMLKRLTYTGSTLRTRPAAFKSRVAQELETRVWPLIEAGRIKPVVRATFDLAQAARAHALMESSGHVGKIVLTVTS